MHAFGSPLEKGKSHMIPNQCVRARVCVCPQATFNNSTVSQPPPQTYTPWSALPADVSALNFTVQGTGEVRLRVCVCVCVCQASVPRRPV